MTSGSYAGHGVDQPPLHTPRGVLQVRPATEEQIRRARENAEAIIADMGLAESEGEEILDMLGLR